MTSLKNDEVQQVLPPQRPVLWPWLGMLYRPSEAFGQVMSQPHPLLKAPFVVVTCTLAIVALNSTWQRASGERLMEFATALLIALAMLVVYIPLLLLVCSLLGGRAPAREGILALAWSAVPELAATLLHLLLSLLAGVAVMLLFPSAFYALRVFSFSESLLPFVWSTWLLVLTLRRVYDFSTGRAVAAALIPLVCLAPLRLAVELAAIVASASLLDL